MHYDMMDLPKKIKKKTEIKMNTVIFWSVYVRCTPWLLLCAVGALLLLVLLLHQNLRKCTLQLGKQSKAMEID